MYSTRRSSRKWFLVPLVIILAFITIGITLSIYFYSSAPTAPTVFPYWFGFFPFGWFFFFPLIFLAFFAFRWFFWGCWGWGRGRYYGEYFDPALIMLRERYAKGEITKEQFDQMTRDLEQRS